MTIYQFPKTLDTNIQPFIQLSSFEWTTTGKKVQSVEAKRISADTIVLPLPTNGITDAISNRWEQEDILQSQNLLQSMIDRGIAGVSKALENVGLRFVHHGKGIAINDFASLVYSGVDFREFSFSYNLIPESSEESKLIADIIKSFKRNSLPEYQGWKILYPNFWKVYLVLPEVGEIIKFKDCVLTNLTDSYFTENHSIMVDGYPAKVNLELSFRELKKLNRSDFK